MKKQVGLALILLGWGTLFAQQKQMRKRLPNIIFFYADKHPELLPHFDEIFKTEHRPAHIKEWEIIDNKLVKK